MLNPNVVQVARMLLAEGHPVRDVHRRLLGRISRSSVQRIATGQRKERTPATDSPCQSDRPAVRCPLCGARVFPPCVRCLVGSTTGRPGCDGELVGLDLKPDHQARYEEIRRGAARHDNPEAA